MPRYSHPLELWLARYDVWRRLDARVRTLAHRQRALQEAPKGAEIDREYRANYSKIRFYVPICVALFEKLNEAPLGKLGRAAYACSLKEGR